jgi:hypothetical protein
MTSLERDRCTTLATKLGVSVPTQTELDLCLLCLLESLVDKMEKSEREVKFALNQRVAEDLAATK